MFLFTFLLTNHFRDSWKKQPTKTIKQVKKEDFCPTQIRMFLTNPYKY